MKEQTKPCWHKQTLFAAVATLVFMFATNSLAVAQDPNFKAGDRVEANMSNYSTSTDWRKATIVEVMMWQGKISGIYVKTDDGRQVTLGEKDVRPLKEDGKKVEGNDQTKPARTAQDGECGVGTRVQGEFGAGAIGTIKEIGTEAPHVGWYLITFDWSPSGEWYYPKIVEIKIVGTNTRCGLGGVKTPEPGPCPMNQPPGKVTNTAKASAQLFKRVIYEWHAAKINPASISAPQQVGLTFLKFEMGAPYKNTLTSSRFGDKRLHDGAPVNVMIYPIKTTELQCNLHGTSVTRSVSERAGDCFKSRSGEWVCPLRTTKFVSRD